MRKGLIPFEKVPGTFSYRVGRRAEERRVTEGPTNRSEHGAGENETGLNDCVAQSSLRPGYGLESVYKLRPSQGFPRDLPFVSLFTLGSSVKETSLRTPLEVHAMLWCVGDPRWVSIDSSLVEPL